MKILTTIKRSRDTLNDTLRRDTPSTDSERRLRDFGGIKSYAR